MLHNLVACSKLSYQQTFMLGTSPVNTLALILLRLYIALHYTELCNSLWIQNLNGYKFNYN
jgi:hypothetical protein